jgi:hypothetical protein
VTEGKLLRPAVGSVAFFTVAPGTVAGVAPWNISGGWQRGDVPFLVSVLGVLGGEARNTYDQSNLARMDDSCEC